RRRYGKADHRIALCRSRQAKDHAGACHPRCHARGALCARRTAAFRPGRWCEYFMSVAEFIAPKSRWLPLRFALRELRSGLNGFYVFILCIALGSMAIAGVGSVAASLTDGLAREGRVILGGDLAFTLIQREIAPNERAFLHAHGQVSSAATLGAVALVPKGQATLVEMKAVDAASPLFGQIKLDPSIALADALAQRDSAFGAVADPTLIARLEISPGARLTIGNATFEIRATFTSEPNKLAAGIGFGPRLLVGPDALRSPRMRQPA